MRRSSLAGLPPVNLPEGYRFRSFQPGDEAAWERIIGESFEWSECAGKFDAIMRADAAFSPQRVLFVCHGDQPVGTASAWSREGYGSRTGYLHYVGVLTSQTGKRLGLQVSLACLHVMAAEGQAAAVLQTDDFRIPALKTYFRLGFAPLLMHENQRQRWRDVLRAIGRPEWAALYEKQLSGPLFSPA